MKALSPPCHHALIATIGVFASTLALSPGAGVVIDDFLAGYSAEPGDEFAPSFLVPGLAASHLRVTSSQSVLEPGTVVPGSVFLYVDQADTLADAVLNEQYFEFELTPDPGFRVQLNSLSLEAARGGASLPRGWGLYSSIDGFSQLLGGGEIPSVQPDFTFFQADLTGLPEFDEAVILRIYAYGPSVSGTGIFFDNIAVVGSLIPEPSTVLLAAIGLLFALRRSR